MGWISYTSSGGTDGLSAFGAAHPNAVVVVSDTDNGIVGAAYEVGTLVCKIYAVQHVKVTEYRGVTHSTAESLKAGVSGVSKSALRTTCGSSWAVVPMFVGVERSAVVSRSNDADGYKLTVTETSISLETPGNITCTVGTPVTNGDVTVSWETGTSA
jgi:hypothetical protein